jgi:raffinose/stachyose/melibiose transport system permease protein
MTGIRVSRVKERVKPRQVLGFVLMLIIAFFFAFPLFMTFMSAFKSQGDILADPAAFPTSLYLGNFEFLFQRTPILQALVNTFLLTLVSQVVIIIVVPMSSYVLARKKSKWATAVYLFFLMGMMIPFQAFMIPLFRQLQFIGLFGTYPGIVIIYLAGSVAFGTLLYTSFIKTTIPFEIEEAALIDGANSLQVFWRIVFPLLAPCTASMVVLNGLNVWNDYLMPMLMLIGRQVSTLIVHIFFFVGQYNTRWGIVFAGAVITIVPAIAIFIALQKYFIKGIAAGAVKG